MKQVKQSHRGVEVLRESSFLSQLDPTQFARVLEVLVWSRAEPGDLVCEQGAPSDGLYILLAGRLVAQIRSSVEEPARVVGEIHPGQTVGEMSLLTREPRSATVVAVRDSLLVCLPHHSLTPLIQSSPALLFALGEVLSRRLHETQTRPRFKRSLKIFSLIPLTPRVNLPPFARELAESLGAWGRTLHLSRQTLHARFPELASPLTADGVDQVVIWLQENEHLYDTIVLEGDQESSPWTRVCRNQCDVLINVVDARDQPSALHPSCPSYQEQILLLLHEPHVSSPRHTEIWLSSTQLDRHHHVRRQNPRDLRRLVRFLTGRAILLSLSGGAALGMAHIGVVRAFEEAGVPIDLACGTSAGATISAQVACGWSADDLQRNTWDAVSGIFFDLDIPMISLLRQGPLRRAFGKLFGTRRIEDQWQMFFCIASNLTHATVERLDRGLFQNCLIASGALPGFYPPVPNAHGDLLADGALLDNLPARQIPSYIEGKRIAVNVLPTIDPTISRGLPKNTNGFRMLARQLNPRRRQPFPNLLHIALRSVFLSGVRDVQAIREMVDLYIEPSLSDFSFVHIAAYESIIERGQEAARVALTDWIASDPEVHRIVELER